MHIHIYIYICILIYILCKLHTYIPPHLTTRGGGMTIGGEGGLEGLTIYVYNDI